MGAVILPALKYKPDKTCAMQKAMLSARRLSSQPSYEVALSTKFKYIIAQYIVSVKSLIAICSFSLAYFLFLQIESYIYLFHKHG